MEQTDTKKSQKVLLRSEVQEKDTWDLTPLFSSLADWNECKTTLHNCLAPLEGYKKTLHTSPERIASLLEYLFTTERSLLKLYVYAHALADVDMTNSESKVAFNEIQSLLHAFSEATSWIEPELLQIDTTLLAKWLQEEILRPYSFYLEKIIRLRPHVLSEEKEALIAAFQEPLSKFSSVYRLFANADLKFPLVRDAKGEEHPLTLASYGVFMRSPDRALRQSAFETMHGRFQEFENSLLDMLSGQAQRFSTMARVKQYSSSLEYALFPKAIPANVYTNLIEAVRSKIDVLHRYYRVKQQALGVETLHLYDSYAPILQAQEKTWGYDEAVALVIESVAPLGKEYQEVLRKGLIEDRWVDRFENQNKASGAYSSGCYDSHPYILMNFKGQLRDVFTLAHEAGHSMHTWYSKTHQPYQYADYPIFLAEVASTFNEELLLTTLLKHATPGAQRAALIAEKLEEIRGTLFRQTMFAEFELYLLQEIDAKRALTPKLIKEKFLELNRFYFGPGVQVDAHIASEWSRIPHFYNNFYVYQYATGISAAMSLAQNILHQENSLQIENARNRYIRFLSSGSSNYPIPLLREAGCDLETTEPIYQAIDRFDKLIDELERELLALKSA